MKTLRFYIYAFCTQCGNSMALMFLSLYLKSLKVDEAKIGGILAIYHAVMPLVVLGVGLLADRISCKLLIMLGTVLSLVYCLGMPYLSSFGAIVFAVCLGGIGVTLSFISINVLFLKTLPEKKRGRLVSIFIASLTSGYASGSALVSILVREFSLPLSIIFYLGAFFHAICILMTLGLPEASIERFPMIRYFHDIRQIPVFCLALLAFSLGIHWGAESFSMVRMMVENFNANGYQMALFFIGTGIALGIFSRIAGHVIENHGGFAHFLIFGMFVSGFMHFITAFAPGYNEFLLIRIVHTCGDGFVTFGVTMLVSLAFPSGRMGGNYGFNRTINNIGSAIGGTLSGFLVARYALTTPFIVTGLFQILAACILWYLKGHLPSMNHGKNLVASPLPSSIEDERP
ncbi:MFS transporter [Candidatus Sumerlaeota bacterium]|nr:MFS transporter [Candidatus Sumerlaeota bacterium]